MRKVLLIYPTIHEKAVAYLKDNCEVFVAPDSSYETLVSFFEKGVEGLVTRTEIITKQILDQAKDLKVIAQNGVGIDNIDVAHATERKIAVLNVPNGNSLSVAEHVVTCILALSKNLFKSDLAVRKGDYSFKLSEPPSEVFGKVVFLVGFGNNARITSEMLIKAFSMSILAFDPYVPKEFMDDLGVEKVEKLEEGLRRSDFISLHLPLTENTFHIIGATEFGQMKKSSFLINCARGSLVDSGALLKALKGGMIKGAALDVFEAEPVKVSDPLLSLDNLIVTPHLAGETKEANLRTALLLAEDLVKALKGEKPNGLVNKELGFLFMPKCGKSIRAKNNMEGSL